MAHFAHALSFCMPSEDTTTTRILLYDADCGFCQRWCDWAKNRGAEAVVSFRSCLEEEPLRSQTGISETDCAHAAYLLELDADRVIASHRAAAAINNVLVRLPGSRNIFWRFLGRLYSVPGLKQLEDWAYKIIARNRHRLGKTSCTRN